MRGGRGGEGGDRERRKVGEEKKENGPGRE